MFKLIGFVVMAFGVVDLLAGYAGFDVWEAWFGLKLPMVLWMFTAYLAITIGLFLFNLEFNFGAERVEIEPHIPVSYRDPRPPAKTKFRLPFIKILIVLAVISGVGYFVWLHQTRVKPKLSELKRLSSKGLNYEIFNEYDAYKDKSFEFFNSKGIRFRTPYLTEKQYKRIKKCLKSRSVTFYYGKWDSIFESDTLFKIYKIKYRNKVLLDYKYSIKQ